MCLILSLTLPKIAIKPVLRCYCLSINNHISKGKLKLIGIQRTNYVIVYNTIRILVHYIIESSNLFEKKCSKVSFSEVGILRFYSFNVKNTPFIEIYRY